MSDQADSGGQCVCGVIMPISHTDDHHTEAHWKAVLGFVEKAISDAQMVAQPVWHNADFDVIQSRILQNLFENEIVVCDVSTRNPNVMLELGMRLTTKKPTIIIAETGTKLPFDTSVINTEFYDPTLKYNEIAEFVTKLTKILIDTRSAASSGTYHAYLEVFKFETVTPANVTVAGDVAIAERLEEMNAKLARIESSVSDQALVTRSAVHRWLEDGRIVREPNTTGIRVWESALGKYVELSSNDANPRIKIGSKVRHLKFGDGVVLEIEGNKLEAEFSTGRKRVMHAFVQLLDDVDEN